jgi:hypothetical protein
MTHHQGAVGTFMAMVSFCSISSTEMPRALSLQVLAHQLHDLGRQALGGLVDDDQVGVAHERAAQREHLLLATRHHARFGVLALLEAREHLVHVVKRPAAIFAVALLPQHQVLVHGQVGEHMSRLLGHVAQAQVRNLVSLLAPSSCPFQLHGALAVHHAHDGLGGGGAARTVAPSSATISPGCTSKSRHAAHGFCRSRRGGCQFSA